ncbi:MAG TPA: hypothetical protein VG796_05145 [Verrucomicrobiales bacterium]|nr:hypothetical protein [Verrucomicrobiales bacterium]
MNRVVLTAGWVLSLAAALWAGRAVRESAPAAERNPFRIPLAPEVASKPEPGKAPEESLTQPTADENTNTSSGSMLAGMKEVLADPSGVSRMEKWVACMASATAADMQGAAELLEEARHKGRFYFAETGLFWNRWGSLDPRAAVAWKGEHINNDDNSPSHQLAAGWASRDPLGVLEWIREPGKFIDPTLLEGTFSTWAASDPSAAGAYIIDASPDDPVRSPRTAAAFAKGVWQSKGKAGVTAWLDTFAGRFQGDMTFPREVFKSLGRAWSQSNDGPAALDFARSHIGKPWFDPEGLHNCLEPFKTGEPGKLMDAVASLPPDPGTGEYYGVRLAVVKWVRVRKDPEGPGQWLTAHPDFAGSDQVAAAYASVLKDTDPAAAQHWAGSIKEEALRTNALKNLQDPSK